MAGPRISYSAALTGAPGTTSSTLLRKTGPSATLDPGLEYVKKRLHDGVLDRGTVNPFNRAHGERLELGSFRNHTDLLVRGAATLSLDSDAQLTVAQEIPFLGEHVVIARLLDGNLTGRSKKNWWGSLQRRAAPGTVHFY